MATAVLFDGVGTLIPPKIKRSKMAYIALSHMLPFLEGNK